jgi:hypothetical protein
MDTHPIEPVDPKDLPEADPNDFDDDEETDHVARLADPEILAAVEKIEAEDAGSD